jgi:hypothetical protein
LGVETRKPQVLVYYDVMERLIDEEEDLIFETKPKILSIGIIILSEETIFFVECCSVRNQKR